LTFKASGAGVKGEVFLFERINCRIYVNKGYPSLIWPHEDDELQFDSLAFFSSSMLFVG